MFLNVTCRTSALPCGVNNYADVVDLLMAPEILLIAVICSSIESYSDAVWLTPVSKLQNMDSFSHTDLFNQRCVHSIGYKGLKVSCIHLYAEKKSPIPGISYFSLSRLWLRST